jgi:DnaJ-class molecular chaperone
MSMDVEPGGARDRCGSCGGWRSLGHARGSACRPTCDRCKGQGWLDPIGPKSDGSYITSRPCPNCDGSGRL